MHARRQGHHLLDGHLLWAVKPIACGGHRGNGTSVGVVDHQRAINVQLCAGAGGSQLEEVGGGAANGGCRIWQQQVARELEAKAGGRATAQRQQLAGAQVDLGDGGEAGAGLACRDGQVEAVVTGIALHQQALRVAQVRAVEVHGRARGRRHRR